MRKSRCPAHCHAHGVSRRRFLGTSAWLLGSAVVAGCSNTADRAPVPGLKPIQQCGPASKITPTFRATFVRRKEPYGMWWPGAVYDLSLIHI